MKELALPTANIAVELDLRTIELGAAGFLGRADALHQSRAFIAIKMAVVVVEIVQLRRSLILQFVIPSLYSPPVTPMPRPRMVGAEQIIGTGDPLVEILLHMPPH